MTTKVIITQDQHPNRGVEKTKKKLSLLIKVNNCYPYETKTEEQDERKINQSANTYIGKYNY